MGQGRDLGVQLRHWLSTEPEALRSGRAISNRLIDALGAHEQLKGPIRDLAARPLLLQVLHGDGAQRSTALVSLRQQLEAVYAPAVLQELLDLLAAASGEALPEAQHDAAEDSTATPTAAATTTPASQPLERGRPLAVRWCSPGWRASWTGPCSRAGAGAAVWCWWCCSGCCRP